MFDAGLSTDQVQSQIVIPRQKVKGAVNFATQLKHESLRTLQPLNLHESRFEPFNDNPEVSSKYK